MTDSVDGQGLSMREMSARSGVSEATLRIWETRHDFPHPHRLPSGHRRYSELDLERVRAVVRAREQGFSLAVAIERARQLGEERPTSLYASLRAQFAHLQPQLLPKRALVHLSHAIEDECATRAERPLLVGCFQHERFYRVEEERWRELARTAQQAVVLAGFAHPRLPDRGPAEIPIPATAPLMREWAVVCHGMRFSACLVGSERPRSAALRPSFETIWTVEGTVVHEAVRVCAELIAPSAPELAVELRRNAAITPLPAGDELQNALALTTRMVRYAVDPDRSDARRRT